MATGCRLIMFKELNRQAEEMRLEQKKNEVYD